MSWISVECNDIYTTNQGIEFIENYCKVFGKITKIEINFNVMKLTNKSGHKIVIDGVFACGYQGGGPSGTYELCQKLGIDVTKEFIFSNEKLKLKVK